MSAPHLGEIQPGDNVGEGTDEAYGGALDEQGTQSIAGDAYDALVWRLAQQDAPDLGTLVRQGCREVATFGALAEDLFRTLYKSAPQLQAVRPSYRVNHRLITEMMGTAEWAGLRAAGTPLDEFSSLYATRSLADRVLRALDAQTKEEINRLHALESGAQQMLAEAEALEDLAQQAREDQADELRRRAQELREQALRDQADAQVADAGLLAREAEIGGSLRRAARVACAAAATAVDRVQEDLAAFGGEGWPGGHGSGPGAGEGGMDVREKIALARRIQGSSKLKQLAAMAGRFRRIALRVQQNKVQHDPDEVHDVTTGRDLSRLLPAELVLLTRAGTRREFRRRYVESTLLQYELIGRERQGQGPIVLAIDNSGSMAGERELWSKAVMLALLGICARQKRDLLVLHFADEGCLQPYLFAGGHADHAQLIECAEYWSGGGTFYEGWMRAALEAIEGARFGKADVIVATDGECAVSHQMLSHWQQARDTRGFRAYGVLIGSPGYGGGVLASFCDSVLDLSSTSDDADVLTTIFSV
jgi:uncharacterized protein with von Willebrand factor type A (vWA) domain